MDNRNYENFSPLNGSGDYVPPSALTTVSPTTIESPQEIIPVEQHNDIVDVQDNDGDDEGRNNPCYPFPGDMMPYDHSIPDYIRRITNQSNLEKLQSLRLKVISTCVSLHRMSAYLPNLMELDLEGSILNSLRDIGCSFKNLKILKVGSCKLDSLDGTFGLTGLRELYAQKNLIKDISCCSNLPHIVHIDVSGNRIRNISYASFLSVCSKLKSIIFTGNPATEVTGYRKYVRKILPQIEVLDGVSFLSDGVDEAKESEPPETLGNESDSSSDFPDYYSVSPSDSMNNLLDSEEDIILLEKRYKQAKNSAHHDQLDTSDYEDQARLSKKFDFNEDSKNLNIQKGKSKKIDKDIEYRSKKSNLLLQSNINEELISAGKVLKKLHTSSQDSLNSILQNESREQMEKKLELDTCQSLSDSIGERKKTDLDQSTARSVIQKSHYSLGNLFKLDTPKNRSNLNQNADKKLVQDRLKCIWGANSLNSGLPLCGNLTAALRNRNNSEEQKKTKIYEGNLNFSSNRNHISTPEELLKEYLQVCNDD